MVKFVDKFASSADFDGYDHESGYQMVPIDGMRTVTVKTDTLAARLSLNLQRRAILIGNFRDAGNQPIAGLNTASEFNNDRDFTLPANSTIRFDIKGNQFVANAAIDLKEIKVNSDTDITLDASIIVGVKAKITKKTAFVFVSDIRGNIRPKFDERSIDPRGVLRAASTSYLNQANMELTDIDDGTPIKEMTTAADLGDPIIVDKEMPKRSKNTSAFIASEVDAKFPGLFASTHFVILLTRRVRSLNSVAVLDINVRNSQGSNMIFFTPFTSNAEDMHKALMHEVGHASGADHNRESRNLMFPSLDGTTKHILAEHIEAIHHGGPVFPF